MYLIKLYYLNFY